jgi:hypothetical protein
MSAFQCPKCGRDCPDYILLTTFATRLRVPQAVVGKPFEKVAEADFRPEFGCQPRQSVSPIARADPAGNPNDHEGRKLDCRAIEATIATS